MKRPVVAVVLAAGKGTRMKSALPKVLHEAAGRPLLGWVLEAARAAGGERLVVVVGHGAEAVRERFAAGDVAFALQEPQLGTGHALAMAEAALGGESAAPSLVLVLSGDVPLVTAETLAALVSAAEAAGAEGRAGGAMAVADLEEPGSLGRVIAGPDGGLQRIVEAADATPEERAVRTVNAGLYALPAPEVFAFLRRLDTRNAQGELYLTDAVTAMAAAGHRVALLRLPDPREALGVNTRVELAEIDRLLVERNLQRLMLAGVTVVAPHRTRIEPEVTVGNDAVIHPDVSLLGRTTVGAGAVVHQGSWLRDASVGAGAVVEPYCVLDGATLEPGHHVGPLVRLGPGARVGERRSISGFVGDGAAATHGSSPTKT